MNDYYSKFPEAQPGVDYAPPSGQTDTQTQYNQGGQQQQQQYYQQPQSTVPTFGTQQQQHYQQPQSTIPSYGQQTFGGQGISLETGLPVQPQQTYSTGHYQTQSQQPSGTIPTQQQQGYNQYEQGGQVYAPQSTQSYGQSQQQYQAPTYGTQNQNQYQAPTQQFQGQGQIVGQQHLPNQGMQQQPRPQPNVGYYYGWWGPQLNQRGQPH